MAIFWLNSTQNYICLCSFSGSQVWAILYWIIFSVCNCWLISYLVWLLRFFMISIVCAGMNYSTAGFELILSRKMSFYIITYYLPSGLFVGISWVRWDWPYYIFFTVLQFCALSKRPPLPSKVMQPYDPKQELLWSQKRRVTTF